MLKNKTKISLEITFFVLLVSIAFFVIALFWYNDYKSIKEFWANFWVYKNIVLVIGLIIFSCVIGVFSKIILGNIFEKIEENNKKLKDYNHYIAHELKTPISVIASNMDVLKYGFDEKIVDKSKLELKNMTKIIDGLLAFSQTIQLVEKKEINLENFLKALIISYKDLDIEIENNLFNFSINTDDILFERVVKNLIENAKKYSSDKTLKITILKEKLIFENLVFEDLNPEKLKNILEKFTRNSDSKNGYGIGLSLIGEILKNLGFEMKIYSENKIFRVEIIY